MSLPTEEDVLSALLLRACRPVVTNCDHAEQIQNQTAWDLACNLARLEWEDVTPRLADEVALRRMAALFPEPIEAAIADSERRLEMARAEQAILATVRDAYSVPPAKWGDAAASGGPGIWARLMGAEGDRRAVGGGA